MEIEELLEYKVEKILNFRNNNKKIEYFIKWKGYEDYENG
jgi:hypothetical protein